MPGEQTTLASQTRSQRVFYSHPFQDYQHVRVCQSQVAKPSQASARQEPVPATTGLYIGSFLKGLFNFRALSVQLEYLHSLQITTYLLTLTLEQVGFSRGGEGDFPCTACCQLPRAQQGRQSHTHTSSPTAAKGEPICSHLPAGHSLLLDQAAFSPPQHPLPKGRVKIHQWKTSNQLLRQGKGKHSEFQENICVSRRRAQIHQSFLTTRIFPKPLITTTVLPSSCCTETGTQDQTHHSSPVLTHGRKGSELPAVPLVLSPPQTQRLLQHHSPRACALSHNCCSPAQDLPAGCTAP